LTINFDFTFIGNTNGAVVRTTSETVVIQMEQSRYKCNTSGTVVIQK